MALPFHDRDLLKEEHAATEEQRMIRSIIPTLSPGISPERERGGGGGEKKKGTERGRDKKEVSSEFVHFFVNNSNNIIARIT